jgi:pimeloyl-ACP methyl ester carboxylesterase
MEILNALSWKRCGVLAHSFGASVSLHALAAFPERFSFYMSIDAFAVFSQYHPSVELPYQLRHALTDRIEHNHNTIKNKEGLKKRLLLYKPDKINMEVIQRKSQDEIMEDAAQNLCKRYRIYGLTIEAARKFVGRMIDIPENKALTTWTYDARLYHHILPMPSEQDLHALIRNLSCPVLLIMAEKGYPFDRKKFEERVRVMKQESRVPFSEVHWLPEMRHHFHMSHPKETADLIIKFFYALEKIPRSKL